MFGNTKNIHFVGIGGVGMSGIAEFLFNQGFSITGSDLNETETTIHLQSIGIKIFKGHDTVNVEDAEVVVKSSAVKDDNPEIQEALTHKIPVIRRAEMLAEIMRMSYGIGIAGTHGKTTTTSMLGHIVLQADLNPTIIVGGKVKNFGSNNILGTGKHIIVEADEYDRSFLALSPIIAGITNIEADHLDCYTNLDDIKHAFIEYANKVPFFGSTVVCLEDKGVQAIIPYLNKKMITYGFSRQADIRASEVKKCDFSSNFNVNVGDNRIGNINLNLPGDHNILNALMAIAIALELNIPFDVISNSLNSFTGVYRRFELKGEAAGISIYDDYAHHPTEIIATLKGIKDGTSRRIVALFQPHLYSRTRDFFEEFGKSFFHSDVLVVTDIFPAREKEIPGITGKMIATAAINYGHRNVHYLETGSDFIENILPLINQGDIVITIGAGSIYRFGEELLRALNKKVI